MRGSIGTSAHSSRCSHGAVTRLTSPGTRLLDVACGTGQPALTAAGRANPGRVSAIDVAPEMLAVARRRAAGRGVQNIEFLRDGRRRPSVSRCQLDAVTCAYALMFCPDPVLAVSEARRVLKPGGRYVAVVWDQPANSPMLTVAGRAVAQFFPRNPRRRTRRARFASPTRATWKRRCGPAGWKISTSIRAHSRPRSRRPPSTGGCSPRWRPASKQGRHNVGGQISSSSRRLWKRALRRTLMTACCGCRRRRVVPSAAPECADHRRAGSSIVSASAAPADCISRAARSASPGF